MVHNINEGRTLLEGREYLPTWLEQSALSGSFANAGNIASNYQRSIVRGTAVIFGDSITQRNGPGPIPNPGETATYHWSKGYFSWFNMLTGKKLRMIKNAGIGGNTTTQMLARIQADVLSYNPGWCFVLGGVNDASANTLASVTIANLDSIYTQLSAAGIRVVALTPWPSNTSTTAQKTELYKVNEWIRKQQQLRKDFYMVDTASTFIDPAVGYPPTSYAADNLHPDGNGAAILGVKIADTLEPALAGISSGMVVSNDDANLIANGMMTGNSSGIASGWGFDATGTQTPTKVPKTGNKLGEWQQVVALTGTVSLRYNVTTGYTAGTDIVYGDCEFEADDDWAANTKFELSVEFTGTGIPAGSVVRTVDMLLSNGDVNVTTIPRRGVLRTPRLIIPAGTTQVAWALRMTGTGTFRVSRASIRKA